LLNCSIEQSSTHIGAGNPVPNGRRSAAGPEPLRNGADALTLAEREEISRAMVEGQSIRSVAARLGRAPSTVSREIKRNGGQSDYRATEADSAAWDRALRPKHCKLVENIALARIVTNKLRLLWSPEQIAGWLKHTYPHDESQRVSHETVYRSLFIQSRGALKKELLQHLRRTRGMRFGLGIIRRRPTSTGRSLVPCRSASDLRPPRIARCLVTGRETCCSAVATARSQRWSSATRGTSCS